MGRLDDLGVVGQSEVVVRTEVDDVPTADADCRPLWGLDQPFLLVQAGLLQAGELGAEVVAEAGAELPSPSSI